MNSGICSNTFEDNCWKRIKTENVLYCVFCFPFLGTLTPSFASVVMRHNRNLLLLLGPFLPLQHAVSLLAMFKSQKRIFLGCHKWQNTLVSIFKLSSEEVTLWTSLPPILWPKRVPRKSVSSQANMRLSASWHGVKKWNVKTFWIHCAVRVMALP